MGRKANIIITASIILLLFLVLLISKKNSFKVENLDEDQVAAVLVKNNNSILYIGKDSKEVNKKLLNYQKEYAVKVYNTNMESSSFNNKYSAYGIEISTEAYVLFYKNSPLAIVGNDNDKEIFDKYIFNKIPESEINYKTNEDADAFIKKVNSKKYTISVFGEESCSYCKLYLNTINNISKSKELNIYYFDSENYDKDSYNKITEALDFTIPSDCTADRNETTLKDGIDKPLTIITKNGKLEGCLLGYVGEKLLTNKLIEVGVINE